MTFLLIAGYPDSLLNFRGPLIDALISCGLSVHVAAPDLDSDSAIRKQLKAKGAHVHDIPLRRTGMNPVMDLLALASLWRLMRHIRPDYVLGYTIKPVIYGSLAAWLAGVPQRYALVTGLGYAFLEGPGERRVLRRLVQHLYRFALAKVNKVFFQNPDDQALFKAKGILAKDIPSVVVNGSGVDISSFAVVPVRSVDALAKAMLKFLDNPGLAASMGAESRKIAEEKYDVHKVNAFMLREMGIR